MRYIASSPDGLHSTNNILTCKPASFALYCLAHTKKNYFTLLCESVPYVLWLQYPSTKSNIFFFCLYCTQNRLCCVSMRLSAISTTCFRFIPFFFFFNYVPYKMFFRTLLLRKQKKKNRTNPVCDEVGAVVFSITRKNIVD